jgi:hypothetical protein
MSRLFHTSWDSEEVPSGLGGGTGRVVGSGRDGDVPYFALKAEETPMLYSHAIDIKDELARLVNDHSFEQGGLGSSDYRGKSNASGRNLMDRYHSTPAAIQALYGSDDALKSIQDIEPAYRDPRGTSTLPDMSQMRKHSDARRSIFAKSFVDDETYSVPTPVTSQVSIKAAQNKLFYNVKSRLAGFGEAVEGRVSAQHKQTSDIPTAYLAKQQVKHTDLSEGALGVVKPVAPSTTGNQSDNASRLVVQSAKQAKLADIEVKASSSLADRTYAGMQVARASTLKDHKHINLRTDTDTHATNAPTLSKLGRVPSVELAKSVLTSNKRALRISNLSNDLHHPRSTLRVADAAANSRAGRENSILSGKRAREVYKNLASARGSAHRPLSQSVQLANKTIDRTKSSLSAKRKNLSSDSTNLHIKAPGVKNAPHAIRDMRKAVHLADLKSNPLAKVIEHMQAPTNGHGSLSSLQASRGVNTASGRLWDLEATHHSKANKQHLEIKPTPYRHNLANTQHAPRQSTTGGKESDMAKLDQLTIIHPQAGKSVINKSASRWSDNTAAFGVSTSGRDRLAGAKASVLVNSTPESRARSSRGVLSETP